MTPSNATRSANASATLHRVLAGHRVEHEQDVRRPRRLADRGELVHQLLVDVQPAGRVEDDGVEAVGVGRFDPAPRDGDGIVARRV